MHEPCLVSIASSSANCFPVIKIYRKEILVESLNRFFISELLPRQYQANVGSGLTVSQSLLHQRTASQPEKATSACAMPPPVSIASSSANCFPGTTPSPSMVWK